MNRRLLWALAVLVAGSIDACSAAHEINEDTAQWSCVDDGNRMCGPNNHEGKPAGCYDDGGVLEFQWPCNAWTPDMGYRHPDGTTTFPNGDVMDDEANVIVVGDHSHDIPSS